MIRLVACDLDGTLMGTDHKFSPRIRAVIAEIQSRDVIVTLATGRNFSSARPYAQQLNISVPLICYQGGWIQALDDKTPRYCATLPDALTQNVLALAAAERWHTALYAAGEVFIDTLIYPADFYSSLLGDTYQVGEPWSAALRTAKADKILFVAAPQRIPAMRALLLAHFAGQVEIVRSHDNFIEVVPRGVNKGAALAWLAAHLNIPQSAVMAIGDQENDLSMVSWAACGVAMGNASDALKDVAVWVAPTQAEDGAVTALERFVLQEMKV